MPTAPKITITPASHVGELGLAVVLPNALAPDVPKNPKITGVRAAIRTTAIKA